MSKEKRNAMEDCWEARPTFEAVEDDDDCICTNLLEIARAIREGGGGDMPLLIEVQADEEGNFNLTAEQVEQLAKAKSVGKVATVFVDYEIDGMTGTYASVFNVIFADVVDVVEEGETIKS